MPTNITKGNSAQFVIEFTDSSGNLATPTTGTLTITYNVSGVAGSTAIALTQSGSFWTGTWDSSPSDLGPATWSITSDLTTSPAAVGEIRVIDP